MKKISLILLLLPFMVKSQITIDHQKPSNYIQQDHVQHYMAGMAISAFGGYTYHYFTQRPWISTFVGIVLGSAVGVGKEVIYDGMMKRGTVSNKDALNTIWGSVVSGLINRVVFAEQEKKGLYNKWLFEDLGSDKSKMTLKDTIQ